MRIDCHSHILPMMDDGSRSIEESLNMIDESLKQGVHTIMLTPHFYASKDSPSSFIARRKNSLSMLGNALGEREVSLLPGAEVQYFEGLVATDSLSSLKIENTELLLIEMPYGKWKKRVLDDLITINREDGYRVVIAHIERHLSEQHHGVLDELLRNNILIQASAEWFLGGFSRRKALKTLEEGFVHLIGSDCHNMDSRAPNIGQAYEVIRKKLGQEVLNRLDEFGNKLLSNKAAEYFSDIPTA